jgi:hypothetical protein
MPGADDQVNPEAGMGFWAYRHGVQVQFIRPGNPLKTPSSQALAGGYERDGVWSGEHFMGLPDARR